MAYDLNYPRLLPLKLDHHIIVNVNTGETFESDKHSPVVAMMHLFGGQCGRGWSAGLPIEQRAEVLEWLVEMTQLEKKRQDPPSFENDLIKVGPFVTWDQCTHGKNSELLTQRMERFVDRGGDLVEPLDREVAERMRSDMQSGKHSILNADGAEPEDMITFSEKGDGKINTVRDVLSSKGGMSGMPPGLADLLGRLGGLGGANVSVKVVDLNELMKGDKKGSSLDDMMKNMFGTSDDEDEKKADKKD